MKRMHLQLLKKANCVLASLLMLLGFSCTDDEGEGPIICEYGTPYANFQIKGKVVDIDAAVTPSVSGNGAAKTATGAGSTQAADIRFGYCTEFIINAEKPADETTEQELKDYLSTIGDSLVVVADDDIVKIHVHTNDPGLAIQKALTYGSLSRIKIDNMREEHQEKLIKDSERLAAQQKAEEEAKAASQAADQQQIGLEQQSLRSYLNQAKRSWNTWTSQPSPAPEAGPGSAPGASSQPAPSAPTTGGNN